MRLRTCSALLLLVSACATTEPSLKDPVAPNPRLANLQRAAALPWTDDGNCVVREAENEWPVLAERCFHALDDERVRFQDRTGRCAVAQAGAAAMGAAALCVLAAPEIMVGAVVVIGVVVVAVAIAEELEAYERRGRAELATEAGPKTARPAPQPRPVQEPLAKRRPEPEGAPLGRDWLPPDSLERERRPECRPVPVPHAGEDAPHNECADKFPPNRYPGMDVLVGGVRFDALQVGVRVLWEIKTHQFDTYNAYVRDREIAKEMKQIKKEREAAAACGYGFVIGVSTQAHNDALLDEDPSLDVVVTGCNR